MLSASILLAILVAHGAGHLVALRATGMRVERPLKLFVPAIGCVECAIQCRTLPRWKRAIGCLGGSAALYVAISIVAFSLYNCGGIPTGNATYVVADTAEGYAARGKLLPGDQIAQLDSRAVYADRKDGESDSMAAIVNESGGRTLDVEIVRDGSAKRVSVTPRLDPSTDRYRIGVRLGVAAELGDGGTLEAVKGALAYPALQGRQIARDLYTNWFRSIEGEVVGVVGIEQLLFVGLWETGWRWEVRATMLLGTHVGLLWLLLDMLMAIYVVFRRKAGRA